jgi:hypothetical protein
LTISADHIANAAWTSDGGGEGSEVARGRATAGGEALAEGAGGAGGADVFICGSNDDYAAELQDEVVRVLLPKHREWAERRPSQALHLLTFLEAPKKLVRYARKKLGADVDLRVEEEAPRGRSGTEADSSAGGAGSSGGAAWRGKADDGAAAADASADAMLAAFDARLASLGGAKSVAAPPPPPPPPPGAPAVWAAGAGSSADAASATEGGDRPSDDAEVRCSFFCLLNSFVCSSIYSFVCSILLFVYDDAQMVRRAAMPAAIVSLDGAGRGKALTMPAWMSGDETAAALGRAKAEGGALRESLAAAAAGAAGADPSQFGDSTADARTTPAKRLRVCDDGAGGAAGAAEEGAALRAKRARIDGVDGGDLASLVSGSSGRAAANRGAALASTSAPSPHAALLEACEAKHPALAACAKWAALRRVVLTERTDVAEAWFRSDS